MGHRRGSIDKLVLSSRRNQLEKAARHLLYRKADCLAFFFNDGETEGTV
jgi:hypothetical protein